MVDSYYKPKTKNGYTTYRDFGSTAENYIYYNKVVDKMEEEVQIGYKI